MLDRSDFRIVYQDDYFFIQRKRKFLFFTFWTLPSIVGGNWSHGGNYEGSELDSLKSCEDEIEAEIELYKRKN